MFKKIKEVLQINKQKEKKDEVLEKFFSLVELEDEKLKAGTKVVDFVSAKEWLEIPVVYVPQGVVGVGNLFGMAMKPKGNPFIVIDDSFNLVNERAKRFIIQHEIGHVVSEHFERIGEHATARDVALQRIEKLELGGICEMELEADAYAASVLGKEFVFGALTDLEVVVRGLRNFYSFSEELSFGFDIALKELSIRKEIIQSK
ncbi:MAG: hypothetical protein N2043_02400 [Ignavibacterium sp.]|nr:hypothetical protein [Ignavibacterium sp.]